MHFLYTAIFIKTSIIHFVDLLIYEDIKQVEIFFYPLLYYNNTFYNILSCSSNHLTCLMLQSSVICHRTTGNAIPFSYLPGYLVVIRDPTAYKTSILREHSLKLSLCHATARTNTHTYTNTWS